MRALALQRCACGGHAPPGGECAACKARRLALQRSAAVDTPGAAGPASATRVLTRPGRPLARDTQAFMESRFGYDFSRVRVHDDREAADSAHAVGAHAYTVGSHVVFGRGQHAPETPRGRGLLAHELTHVLQQDGLHHDGEPVVRPARDEFERESDDVARQVLTSPAPSAPVRVQRLAGGGLQRYTFGSPGPIALGGTRRFVEANADQRREIDRGLQIVSRVVNNPRDHPACPRFFQTNCPGGTATSLADAFNRAVIWFQEGAPSNVGATTQGLNNIGFTPLILRIGRWAIAASFVHELMHVCGQDDHDIADRAKEACGRLPDIISISPRIEISNPL